MWKLFLLASLAGSMWADGTASGKLVVNGKTRALKAVRAVKLMEDGQEVVRVFVSDAPVAAKFLFDDAELISLGKNGDVHGVVLDFRGSSVVLRLRTKDHEGSSSRTHSPNPYKVNISAAKVAGEVREVQAAGAGSNLSYKIAMKFSAAIETKAPEAVPTAEDAKAAAANPAVISYLDFMDALKKGDRARIRAHAPTEAHAQIESPDFPEMLKTMQAIQAHDLHVLKAVTTAGETQIWVTGKSAEGKLRKGEVTMKFQEGRWIMRKDNWRD